MSQARDVMVVVDGKVFGHIEVSGELSFKTMARESLNLPGLREELQRNGVFGWGFDGGNFYITTTRKKARSFSPNFQWFLAPMGREVPKMNLGPNPFEDLL